jgi:hypothetical protein
MGSHFSVEIVYLLQRLQRGRLGARWSISHMIIHYLVPRTPFTGLLQPRHLHEGVMIHDIGILLVVVKFHMRATQITGCHRHRLTLAMPTNLCPKICRIHFFRAGLQMLRTTRMEPLNQSSEHKRLAWRGQPHQIVLVRNLLSSKDSVQLRLIDALAGVEETPPPLLEKPLAWSEPIQIYRKYLTYHINISPTTT